MWNIPLSQILLPFNTVLECTGHSSTIDWTKCTTSTFKNVVFIFLLKISIFISYGYCNKWPKTPWLLWTPPRGFRFLETDSRQVGIRAGWRGMGSYSLMGTVPFHKLRRTRRMGDGRTTPWMYLVPLNWTFKNGYDGKLSMYFTTLKKKKSRGTCKPFPAYTSSVPSEPRQECGNQELVSGVSNLSSQFTSATSQLCDLRQVT